MTQQHLQISSTEPRIRYQVGATPADTFEVPFEFFAPADLEVYIGTTLAGYSASPAAGQWRVEGVTVDGGYQGGQVVLGAPVTETTVTIVANLVIDRLTDFPYPSPTLNIRALNTQSDRTTLIAKQLASRLRRTIRLPETDPTVDMVLQPVEVRAGRPALFDDLGRLVAADDQLGIGASEWGSDFGLPQDGATDIAPLLSALMEERQAAGIRTTRYVPRRGEPLPYIASFLKVPPEHNFDRSQARFRRGKRARIGMSGRFVELPETGKYRLASPVTAGDTTIYLDTPSGGSLEALQTAEAAKMTLIIRGENDAVGESLQKEEHGFTIVDDSDPSNIEVLLSEPAEFSYAILYDDSAWQPAGPASDYTLISVTAGAALSAPVPANALSVELVEIPAGLVPGRTVVLKSQELVPSGSSSSLPYGLEVHRVRSVEGLVVTFTEVTTRDFPLDQAPALLLREPFRGATIVCGHQPDIWAEAPDPAPASRIDGYTMQHVDECTIIDPWVDDAATEHYIRGAGVVDRQGYNNRVVNARIFRRPGANSGDQNGIVRFNAAFGSDDGSFVTGASNAIMNQGGYAPQTTRYLGVDNSQGWDTHGCGCVGAVLDTFEIVGGTALSANTSFQRGVEVGNSSHRARDENVSIRNGVIRGFSAADAAGLVIRPSALNASVQNVLIVDCETGARLIVDDRAGLFAIDGVRLDGVEMRRCGTGLSARGRPADWEAEAAVAGTVARPVWKTASGALWSTTTTGTTGTEEPDPGSEPVENVTTSSDGSIIWTYRGLVQRQIHGLEARVAVLEATSAMDIDSVDGLALVECRAEGAAGIALASCPGGIVRNLRASIDGDGPYLIDGGGNDGTELDGISAGASGIDDSGGSTFVISAVGGAALPSGPNTVVMKDGADEVALRTLETASLEVVGSELRGKALLSLGEVLLPAMTTARELTDADRTAGSAARAGQIRRLPINLGSPGTIRVPAAATPGVYHLVVRSGSATASLGVTGDVGSVNGEAGDVLELIGGSQVIVDVVENPGSAPVVMVLGAKGGKTVHGDLVGADQGSGMPHALAGFNALIRSGGAKTASFTFDAPLAGALVGASHGSVAIVGTIPAHATVAYPLWTILAMRRGGAADVSFAAAGGVTLDPPTGYDPKAAVQGAIIFAVKADTNVWWIFGGLAVTP